ncbi:uncharacterized protein AB9X84_010363 [Acanthopagrus schlegelii]
MAGSGVALRLHQFRESQNSRQLDGPTALTAKNSQTDSEPQVKDLHSNFSSSCSSPSRLGRDARGLYPGELGRVHTVHPKDCG